MRRLAFISALIVLGTLGARAQRYDRGYETLPSTPFMKKGTWMIGGTAGYTQHTNRDFSILIIENINSKGYNVSASPMFCYALKDNQALGARFSYSRGMLDFEEASLSVMDITLGVKDYYKVSQDYQAQFFWRMYIPFGTSRRFAMFGELQLGGSLGQSKITDGHMSSIKGSYEKDYKVFLGVNPGIVAFLTNHFAIEANLGLLGFNYTWTDQIHNQVGNGSRNSVGASFMLNFLSIGMGLCYYL